MSPATHLIVIGSVTLGNLAKIYLGLSHLYCRSSMARRGLEQSHEIQNFVFWTSVLHRVSRLCFALPRCERITESKDHIRCVPWRLYTLLDCGGRRFGQEIRLRPRSYLRRKNSR